MLYLISALVILVLIVAIPAFIGDKRFKKRVAEGTAKPDETSPLEVTKDVPLRCLLPFRTKSSTTTTRNSTNTRAAKPKTTPTRKPRSLPTSSTNSRKSKWPVGCGPCNSDKLHYPFNSWTKSFWWCANVASSLSLPMGLTIVMIRFEEFEGFRLFPVCRNIGITE